MSNYDNSPYIKINGYDNDAYSGYAQIDKKIKESLGNKKIVVVDCYLGINDRELLNVLIKKLTPAHVILSEDIFYDGKKLTEMMQVNLTEDRVRGVMYYGTIRDYVDDSNAIFCRTSADFIEALTVLAHDGDKLNNLRNNSVEKANFLSISNFYNWFISEVNNVYK